MSLIINLILLARGAINGKAASREAERTAFTNLRITPATGILAYIDFFISLLTVFMDAYLTIVFLRHQRNVKEANLNIDFSKDFAIRLLILCIIRLAFFAADLALLAKYYFSLFRSLLQFPDGL
ncbi:hypothetical protein M422DRAFT_262277 [Sphaerobolus stellatus SS14]|uniref:Uncharacterized protein n=1 Tax=Sphaerobolus stellatus (strain SS14) TaxID=990650 RepID=A0A0C9TYE8_SPHS4|nr:hypothetical protein M422DRAFT_262277 [Sphaerobolus stellatus SS14]